MASLRPPWVLGRRIAQICFGYDAVNVGFDDETSLAVYNPCSLVDAFHPSLYIGAAVTIEVWRSDQFSVELGNGSTISVDLRDEAWTGPEAMVFYHENNGIMVVNEPPEGTETFREETDK